MREQMSHQRAGMTIIAVLRVHGKLKTCRLFDHSTKEREKKKSFFEL